MHAALDTIWASLPIPAILVDEGDKIAEINPAAEGFFNTSNRAINGVPLFDRLMVDAPLEAAYHRAREHSTALFVNDVDVGTGDRAPLQCNLKFAPVLEHLGFMILLLAPRELAGWMSQTQTVKSAAKSAIGMAEMLAHEIKNPLAGITGAAQLLSMGLEPKDLELTDLIVEETRRIVKLLEQVEQFGNLREPIRPPWNLHEILDRVRRSALLGLGAHMTITDEYDPSLPAALGDIDQLMQVIMNLVKNAAEASPQGGTIRLRTYYEHSFRLRRSDSVGQALPLQVEVWDDGPGLPDEIKNDIFDPFVSGRENGTGLGLALASKIISEHGGWISVNSVPGRTVFRMSLPMATTQKGA